MEMETALIAVTAVLVALAVSLPILSLTLITLVNLIPTLSGARDRRMSKLKKPSISPRSD